MTIEQGVFSSPARAWTALAAYTLFLYGTLVLAFDLYAWLLDRIGWVLPSVMTWMYVPIGLALLVFLVFFLPKRWGAYFAFAVICLVLAACLRFLAVPAKRFHFFEYGILAVLVFDALRFHCRGRSLYFWSLATVALIGAGDESLQGLLPKRYFGLLDLGVDVLAGVLTLGFIRFVMGTENYPFGRRVLVRANGAHSCQPGTMSQDMEHHS